MVFGTLGIVYYAFNQFFMYHMMKCQQKRITHMLKCQQKWITVLPGKVTCSKSMSNHRLFQSIDFCLSKMVSSRDFFSCWLRICLQVIMMAQLPASPCNHRILILILLSNLMITHFHYKASWWVFPTKLNFKEVKMEWCLVCHKQSHTGSRLPAFRILLTELKISSQRKKYVLEVMRC